MVLVLLQVSIQYYRREDSNAGRIEQIAVLVSVFFAAALLTSSGYNAADLLLRLEYPQLIQDGLLFIQNSLLLLTLPVLFIILAVITDILDGVEISTEFSLESLRSGTEQESNTSGTDEESKNTGEATNE
ncbi:hypothetical protein DJ80_15360 [Halorubrum ezzemoulense]|uniref:Uncharacterized protein n=1 Tax=Halorubrum ezzemoulense TaxID=337243 RepID=A0A256IWJ6_HALEZ|nr:hypothetical protein DJ80_15360 [Halorubrum ezzemoulense]